MEINIDIANGYFSVKADINSGAVLQEAINNFFTAYFDSHKTTVSDIEPVHVVAETKTGLSEAGELGVVVRDGQVMVSSRDVANAFGKRHCTVMRDIRMLDCSAEFSGYNFVSAEYRDTQNKGRPEIFMTRDGFTFLVMGYNGKLAGKFKEAYIRAFNAMEEALHSRLPE
ncbi:MAG: Rha family transcriptional regulator [Synergistaceae bacterium]|nr:Rha family transcriptional regulator [Synergistaceae bacterium]